MGVWHFSGLGLSAGAVTVPLTYIYLILKAANYGDTNAQKFFETSGEKGQDIVGTPEAIILFTSEEVIKGEKVHTSIDKWFNTPQDKSVPKTIAKYLSTLIKNLKDENFSIYPEGIKYIYLIKVNHEDYQDCFFNTYTTLKGLEDKEIWINMVGGTNQINSALLTASGLTGISARYYYFFQRYEDIKFLHPNIKKPNFKNPKIEIPPTGWYELPVFWFEAGKLIEKLNYLFEGDRVVNVGEIKGLLSELEFPERFYVKLTGSRLIKQLDADRVVKGEMLDLWNKGLERAMEESKNVRNFTEWRKWASNKGILWELTLDGKCNKINLD